MGIKPTDQDDLHAALTELHRLFTLAERKAAAHLNANMGDIHYLRAVEAVGVTGGMPEMERYLCLPQQTISTALKRLEQQNLIQRLPFEEKALDGTLMKGRRTVAFALDGRGRSALQAFDHRERIERERVLSDHSIDVAKIFSDLPAFLGARATFHRSLYSDQPSRTEQIAGRAIDQAEAARAASGKSSRNGARK